MPAIERTFTRQFDGDASNALTWASTQLAAAGFRLGAAGPTTIHGERGSPIAMSKRNVPMSADVSIDRTEKGPTLVQVHLQDRLSVPFASSPVKRNYEQLFAQIERDFDAAFGTSPAAEPRVAAPAPPPPAPPAPPAPSHIAGLGPTMATLGEQAGGAMTRLAESAQATAAAVTGRSGSEAWQRVEHATFTTSRGPIDVDAARIQSLISVATMVERQPGSLPDNLAEQLAAFTERLLEALEVAGAGQQTTVRHGLAPSEEPILTFLQQQARAREQLPVRTLHHCTACGHEKVSNPDYKRLMDRKRKIQALTGAVGLTMRSGTVSPFLLVGALFRMKNLDPDYVCPRCQGMDSDDCIATFCPQCGSLHAEAVLRTCPKCQYRFLGDTG